MTAALRGRPAANAHEAIRVIDVHMRAVNMSRDMLAKKSGVSDRALEKWWNGKVHPRVMLLEAVLGVFDLKLKVTSK